MKIYNSGVVQKRNGQETLQAYDWRRFLSSSTPWKYSTCVCTNRTYNSSTHSSICSRWPGHGRMYSSLSLLSFLEQPLVFIFAESTTRFFFLSDALGSCCLLVWNSLLMRAEPIRAGQYFGWPCCISLFLVPVIFVVFFFLFFAAMS